MVFFKAHAAVASGCFEISEKWCQHNKQQKHARSFWKARLGGQYSFRRMKRRVQKMFGNKQEQTHTHRSCLFDLWSHSQYMQNIVLLCGGCLCCGLHMLCFDVRHWFRSSCRLAAVRRWRWTGHRCIGIDRCLYKIVGLMTCLCRYKVLLLKPHLRDMLASARRRRDIRCYSWVFLHDQMFDICKCCHSRILHMRLHGTIETWFYWQRWDVQDVNQSSPSQSRHRASRKGRDFGALWDWNDEVNEGIFGSSWTCLVSLSATSSRMFNQSPAHTAELGSNMFPDSAWQARASYLQMTCRLQMKTMRRAARVGSFWFFLVDLHVMHLQAQPATSSRHVGFDKDVDKSRWHSPEAHGACCDLFWHLPHMWQTCGGRARSFAFSEAS